MDKMKIIAFFFLIVFLAVSSSGPVESIFAESDGYIDVEVTAPVGFDRAIMINFFAENGANYLTTAEPVNQFKSNFKLPVGKYTIDFVSIDNDPKAEFIAEYSQEIEVKAGKGSQFEVVIKNKTEKNDRQNLSVDTIQPTIHDNDKLQTANQDQVSIGRKIANDIKKYSISILVVVIILIVLAILKIRKNRIE